jgi:23S rRNA (uracil1939-C5)-methyltransferase
MRQRKEPTVLSALSITELSSDGRGIARHEGKVIFVEQALPGDVVEARILKSKKNFSEGKIQQLQTASPLRIAAECSHFGVCGGCKWQHLAYEQQLLAKQKIVADAFRKIGKLQDVHVPAVTGCENPYYYRNKLEFAFTNRRWLTDTEIEQGITYEHRNGVGFHVPGNYLGVIDIDHCYLQAEPSNAIRLAVKAFALQHGYTFFNQAKQEGLLRNLMVRTTSLGEVLALFSFHEPDMEKVEALLNHVAERFPQITSLQYVINPKRNDTIYDLETVVFKGKDHVSEQLGAYTFKIGPKSFFQTNTKQAKVLYDVALQFAGLQPDDVVYDLYTGVGSIALYVSGHCQRVTGIEQVEEAIVDAKENAQRNQVENCTFYAGDVRMILNPAFIEEHGRPRVVITDPPRAGMHEDVVKTLLALEAPVIVYVSCNPATQARDLELLSEKYEVTAIQPVDLFPHTTHIENVARLELRATP